MASWFLIGTALTCTNMRCCSTVLYTNWSLTFPEILANCLLVLRIDPVFRSKIETYKPGTKPRSNQTNRSGRFSNSWLCFFTSSVS